MYIFGGYEEELDRFSDDIHTYNFETNMWEFVQTKVMNSAPNRRGNRDNLGIIYHISP